MKPISRLWRRAVALAASVALCGAAAAPAAEPNAARNLVLQPTPAPVAQTQRLALVIGNSAYREAPLANPVNDAQAMAAVLRSAGFAVMLHTDVDLRGLHGAVREFGNRLRQGGVGLFFFAGHGMQIKGRNYLIPIGADIQREDEVPYSALDAQAILDKMESAGNGANLMLLDACRNNPFARSFRSSTLGLAQMEAPVGTLVAFSTAPGTVASDGAGRHGLYTQHLLEAMRRPGNKVEDVFKQVRAAVRRASRGQQIPWETTSLEGDLYFFEPPPVVAAPPAPPAIDGAAIDDALWATLKDSPDAAVMRAYLDRFPEGRHAAAARRRLEALTPAPAAPAPAAGPSTPPPLQQAATPAALPPAEDARLTALLREEAARVQRRVGDEIAQTAGQAAAAAEDPAAGDRVVAMVRAQADAAPPRTAPDADAATQLLAAPAPAPVRSSRSIEGAVRGGDRWTYHATDRWRGVPDGHWTLYIESVAETGTVTTSDEAQSWSSRDVLIRQLLAPRAFGIERNSGPGVWWNGLQAGDKRDLVLAAKHRRSDGNLAAVESKVTLTRKGVERIEVPFGSFLSHRLDATAVDAFRAVSGATAIQHWTMTLWYSPELRGFVRIDADVRAPGGNELYSRIRRELVGFEPGPAPVAAR